MVQLGTGVESKIWRGTADTDRVSLIREMVFESLKEPITVWTARAIAAKCPQRDDWCELEAIYKAIKHGPIPSRTKDGKTLNLPGFRFVDDVRTRDVYMNFPRQVEWLSTGANGQDCDEFTSAIAALAMAIGFAAGAVIVSRDNIEYTHIFPIVGIPKSEPEEWIAMDATVKEASVGWLPPPSYGVKKMMLFAFAEGKLKGRRIK